MRLIDADRLIEILNDWWFKARPSTYEPKEVKAVLKITANVIENCIDIVNDRPTAHYIDKVIDDFKIRFFSELNNRVARPILSKQLAPKFTIDDIRYIFDEIAEQMKRGAE